MRILRRAHTQVEGVDTLAEPIAATVAPEKQRSSKVRSVPNVKRRPWDQRPVENDLWYVRFLRYVALGPSRSVSLVSKGKRNQYPVPAHWPVVAKQHAWKDRAREFDQAVSKDTSLILVFFGLLEDTLSRVSLTLALTDEPRHLRATIEGGGYLVPPPAEDDNWPSEQS